MAKGIGLIGNFKGKVGNTVGYKLSASNTGNTQGIRVYQPIVRNPKTSAQAEQRAKLAPINATYRALKMVIDRGYEGIPYGNKSRLAWLKKAFKAENMPWIVKGEAVKFPVGCPLTKGSLSGLNFDITEGYVKIAAQGVTAESIVNTVGTISTALLAAYPQLKAGDQVSIVTVTGKDKIINSLVYSFVVDTTSVESMILAHGSVNKIVFEMPIETIAGAVIVSREGANGEHLRSNTSLIIAESVTADAPYDAASKAAAIASYQSSASANSDWAEESIQ